MIASALQLAGLGLAVFPVAGDCRAPLTRHGYKDASKAAEAVRALWRGHPTANVAVACGAVSGVFVLDVDVKGADGIATLKDLAAEHGGLPKSWLSRTPTGGLHLWFQYASGLKNRVGFRPGLDVRTDGGSVASPPSHRFDGAYTWAPGRAPWQCHLLAAPRWLTDIIAPPEPPRRPPPPIRTGTLDSMARYVARAIDGECAAVINAGPGGRNHRLFQAAANLGELAGAGLVSEDMVAAHLEDAADACGLVRDDGRHAVLGTIRSGLQRGLANPRDVAR
jgi:putative DNA primase/helicase